LPALEYVASRLQEDGVLVLSELAGAADLLHHAVPTNPHSPDSVASALRQALELAPAEVRIRMRGLREEVARSDMSRWRQEFTQHAFGDAFEIPTPTITPLPRVAEPVQASL
jgi:trehalose-6-phosphate synthase